MRCWVCRASRIGKASTGRGVLRCARARARPTSTLCAHLHQPAADGARRVRQVRADQRRRSTRRSTRSRRALPVARRGGGQARRRPALWARRRRTHPRLGGRGRGDGVLAGLGPRVGRAAADPPARRADDARRARALEADGEYYRPFQLYGYDFLVDDELRVWLCEISGVARRSPTSSSPASWAPSSGRPSTALPAHRSSCASRGVRARRSRGRAASPIRIWRRR